LPQSFVHLRLHTEYSLRDSVVRVPELMATVRADGMPAIALTDRSNLFAGLKFYRAALEHGVQPLLGADLLVRADEDRSGPWVLPLLCQNLEGYRNLCRLISRAWLDGQRRGEPLIARDWLTAETTAGLIALSGAPAGEVGRLLVGGKGEAAEVAARHWAGLFAGRYYLEVQRLGRAGEEALVHATVRLAEQLDLPVVATNDVRFLKAEEFTAHEARVCIAERQLLADPNRPRRYTEQQYLRSTAEMQQLFADLPAALANTVEIARRCSLTLKLGKAQLPRFPVPEGSNTDDFLRAEAARGLEARGRDTPHVLTDTYRQRLAAELDVICKMGFAGYFLIVADFIRWSRNNGVPVGPGRGSGAGSLVAWSLGITDIDPIKYDLLFERFLNPERVSMPDFDVDFCMEGRDRVIDYVAHKYGTERVSQIITYGTMAARAVVRDAGRVLGQPFPMVDRIAKLVPFELEMTLAKAIEQEPELRKLNDSDEEVRVLLDMARSLEGLTRNAGKHAGGVVIAPSVLTDFAPLYSEEGGVNVVTQFDKDDVEAAGLVKFDFLGLRTLTIIDWALRTINAERAARGEPPINLAAQTLDDAATYALLQACRTTAVFQLESRGMKDLIRKLQPDCFEDVIALVALFRPGPLQSGMVDDFITRKKASRLPGEAAAIDYLHPELKPVLQPTYGVILYQEQVMQIARVLAGYTLGGADLLRRAMGKKKPEEMAQQRSIFIGGATARGVPERQAAYIFDLMEKFAGYGFNKSHSAAYAVLSYQTAWLKAHYPAAFMAAVMSADMDRTEKVVTLIDDCAAIGLTVQPPDVNGSQHMFTVAGEKSIRYGLGAVKGVGQAAVEPIVPERQANGPYTSLGDLTHRVDLQRVNKRVLEALIRCGSMDALGPNRATLWAELADAMRSGEQRTRSSAAGQNDMFGLGAARVESVAESLPRKSVPEWNESQRLAGERETLGLYLTGHPIARCERDLRYLVTGRIADYANEDPPGGEVRWSDRRTVTIAGLIMEVIKRGTRVSCVLDDRTGRMEVAFSDDNYQRFRQLIERDAIVLIEGGLRFDEFSNAWRVQARNVQLLDAVRERQARTLVLDWPTGAGAAAQQQLAALLRQFPDGQCAVALRYSNEQAAGTLLLGPAWQVRPAPELLEGLESLCGPGRVRLSYAPPVEAVPASRAAAV
jgi:DNA polymerase III subunit alpha